MTNRRHLPDHAPYSPSGMHRIIECPLSVSLSKQAPPEPASPYAEEGTRAHEWAEKALLDGEVAKECPDDMRPHVQTYFDYCDPLLDAAAHYGIETKVVADNELFGTVDCWVFNQGQLELIDFKYGSGHVVEAEENLQLMTYAACLFLDEEIKISESDVDGIKLTIIQPRAQGEPISSWVTTCERIDTHLKTVDGAINASKQPNPPGAMGDWCKWCAAKIICPVLSAAEEGVMTWDHRDLPSDEIGALLHTAQILEQKAKAIFAYAHARMEEGERVPGWKLVPKRATRRWSNEAKVLAWAKRAGRLKIMQDTKLISPAQASKVLSDEEFESLEKHVKSVSSGTNIKPSDDPAEEVDSLGNALSAIGSLPKR